MNRTHAFCSCLILTCGVFVPHLAVAQDLREKLTTVIQQEEKNGFRGQVVVHWAGEPVLSTAVGMADPSAKRPNSKESLFYIGSVAKVITAATTLQLVDQGVLKIDASIEEYLPDVEASKRAITIRHLLAHQSGLPANHDNPLQKLSRDEFVSWALDQELSFEPGKGWAYSNIGYSLLAAIIEHATNKPFQEVIRKCVLSTAGMTSTYFLDELNDQHQPLLAMGKGPLCEEFNLSGRIDEFETTWLRYGPGAIVSTASDLAKLCEAIDEGQVYSKKGLDLATTDVRNGWGLGWRLSRTRKGTPLHYHDGGFAGFHAVMARLPAEEGYVVLLSNREKAAESLTKALLGVLLTHEQ